tara:strand:- start:2 stop:628 length:627 start_codon:yes stop_codon:yes gene_type:complete
MKIPSIQKLIFTVIAFSMIQSCETIESTVDSTIDSISEAGDFLYDSVNFWEDDEPEQSEAVVIEEAVEVPDYALPDTQYFEGTQQQEMNLGQFQPPIQQQTFYDPIYRSQRQYYYVGPNGTPMLAPPPPPFPQYSIDQAAPLPYSYSNNLGIPQNYPETFLNQNRNPQNNNSPAVTLDEEMELFGIQNNCVRVAKDYVNGGFMCDDYD